MKSAGIDDFIAKRKQPAKLARSQKRTRLAGGHDLPGHASIVTTERYDTRRPEALMAAAKLLEPVRK
jgi:hypothetical protein